MIFPAVFISSHFSRAKSWIFLVALFGGQTAVIIDMTFHVQYRDDWIMG